jgi:epoxyqueuosine reductase
VKRTFSGFWPLRLPVAEALAQAGFDVSAALDVGEAARAGWLEPDLERWRQWIAAGAHADMHFMEENEGARADARLILQDALSAIVVLVPYATGNRVRRTEKTKEPSHGEPNPSEGESDLLPGERPLLGAVARYARGADYHKVIKKRLDAAARLLFAQNPAFRWRVVVDSIPFFDRAHAREAGLGFVGKNSMLLRPGMGSYFFIATLLTNQNVDWLADPKSSERETTRAERIASLSCGDCRACLDACPTNALPSAYFLDASRCLSYFTIEHRDIVPDEFLPSFKDTLYGCDACQDVCPYNFSTLDLLRIADISKPRESLLQHSARDLALLTRDQYETWFGGMAMTRAKYSGLIRNALYFLYANGDPDLPSLLLQRKNDAEPLVARTVRQLENLLAKRAPA